MVFKLKMELWSSIPLIYQKLQEGYVPKVINHTSIEKPKNDLYYIEKVLNVKRAANFSKHHQNALKLAYNRLREALDVQDNIEIDQL